jgi:hypothetical protein
VIDGACWRAYREVAGHWLHWLRGPLNAMSLSLSLVEAQASGAAGAGGTPTQALRRQLGELSAGLTRLLDYTAEDEAPPGRCDVVAIAGAVCGLVKPLADHLRVGFERPAATDLIPAEIDATTLRAVLLHVLVDAVKRSEAGSAVSLRVEALRPDVVRVDVRIEADIGPVPSTPGFLDASARVLRRHGGELRRASSGSPAYSVVLPRAPGSSTSTASAPPRGTGSAV